MNHAKTRVALIMIFLAGWLDAITYFHLRHSFVAVMSGNSTQLGIAAGHGSLDDFARYLLLVGGFLGGATLGSWLEETRRFHPKMLLGLVGILCGFGGAFSVGAWIGLAIFQLSFAMGLLCVILRRLAGPAYHTYVTGSLIAIGDALAKKRRPWPELAVWTSFVGGAAIGVWLSDRVGYRIGLSVPPLGYLLLIPFSDKPTSA